MLISGKLSKLQKNFQALCKEKVYSNLRNNNSIKVGGGIISVIVAYFPQVKKTVVRAQVKVII